MNSDVVKEFDRTHKSLYEYVSQNSGSPANMDKTSEAFDVLRSQKAHGLKLPEWVTDEI